MYYILPAGYTLKHVMEFLMAGEAGGQVVFITAFACRDAVAVA